MTTTTRSDYVLHVLRNPYGFDAAKIKEMQLAACDIIEQQQKQLSPTHDDLSTLDKGPWQILVAGKSLNSDDFKHDVKITVDGDFESQEKKEAYLIALRDRLNAATHDDLSGWLIEFTSVEWLSPQWVGPDMKLVKDANDAIRFGRKCDAEAFMNLTYNKTANAAEVFKKLLAKENYTITEHIFTSATHDERREEWQPIETAPKDGRRIVGALWSGMHCYWVHDMAWRGASFWKGEISFHPTHWRPLTQSPTSGAK